MVIQHHHTIPVMQHNFIIFNFKTLLCTSAPSPSLKDFLFLCADSMQSDEKQGLGMVINHHHTITVTQATYIRIVSLNHHHHHHRHIHHHDHNQHIAIFRESMPASNGAPIDSVDSSFGLTTPRGYSGAKEVCHFRGMNVILSVFARNPILTSSEIILRCHKVDVILMISVFIKVFNKQLGIYQRPMSAHGVSSLSFVWPCFSLNFHSVYIFLS